MNKIFKTRQKEKINKSATPALARQFNIRKVIEILRSNPPLSRAEITRLSGISSPTMTKVFKELQFSGIIREVKSKPSGRGRPSKCYTLSGRKLQVFGALIGVKQCRIFTASPSLKLKKINERIFATPHSYHEMLLQFRQFIEEQLKSKIQFMGLGISVPGLINTPNQSVETCPNIHYLNAKSPALDISKNFNLKTVTIQEEHALCLAEHAVGNAKNIKNFVMLDISEGMGMGVFSNGVYLSGECGFAGEIGHIPLGAPSNRCGCGRSGCLETSATDMALLKMLALNKDKLSMDKLKRMLSFGEINIDNELETVLDYLAKGLSVIINLFNPRLILINGRLFDLKPGLLEKLKSTTKDYAMAPSCNICEIKRTSASRDTGVLASISNALIDSIVEQ